jgi:hypothetical protein
MVLQVCQDSRETKKITKTRFVIASHTFVFRTDEIRGAKQLVDLFGWEKYFKYKEIYPGCKKTHFKKYVSASEKICQSFEVKYYFFGSM